MNVQSIKEKYPAGSWIRLTEDIEDPYHGQKKNSCGEVVSVDDIGTIHTSFGGKLFGVMPEIDSFVSLDVKTDPVLTRCRDCAYLIEDDEGCYICDDCRKNIFVISDSDCSANQSF